MESNFNAPRRDEPNADALRIRKAIGQSIARARQDANLTQESVAEMLGIGPEAVSRLERGVGSITAERLVVLAQMFGCRSDQLLLGASERPEDQAGALWAMLDGLSITDRDFVLGSVDQLVAHLRRRAEKNRV
ncbi:helix-turn-helix transcriptional regulator [Massilia forsythiae]|uniref:Helix-turn-helix transcriptional regulator n=1 Tax=Massilia forsythiae TaxID=2728020 RepID=A0A7Z2ZVV9_9BURK|nr:helix-turn-helix transcriptional regulator [Massilia forsythiae]QJE02532.1 helix-turn-helix transcriptional regulator [Massilia forsythiae]